MNIKKRLLTCAIIIGTVLLLSAIVTCLYLYSNFFNTQSTPKSSSKVQTALEDINKTNSENDKNGLLKYESNPVSKIELNTTNCEINGLENIEYDGNVHTLGLSIIYDGKSLKNNTDYTVKYNKELTDPDQYKAVISFKGKYRGEIIKKFNILPKGTEITDISTRTNNICISFEKQDDKSTGYEIEYSKDNTFSNGKIYEVDNTDTNCVNIPVKADNSKYFIRVRTYLDKDNCKLESKWSETKSAELMKIIEKDGLVYVDGLPIANKTYALPESYNPGEDSEAVSAFNEMANDAMLNDNIYLCIVSGFRSYEVQDNLYNYYVSERGVENADRVSARPGHSEHQLGLAFDINTTSSSFAGTPEAIWLDENCWKYGFIIRYPEGKEDITGYAYEPWHIRYIGKDYSKKVFESHLTLEEYLGITSKYSD